MDFAYVHVLVKLAYVHVHWYVCVCTCIFYYVPTSHRDCVHIFIIVKKRNVSCGNGLITYYVKLMPMG